MPSSCSPFLAIIFERSPTENPVAVANDSRWIAFNEVKFIPPSCSWIAIVTPSRSLFNANCRALSKFISLFNKTDASNSAVIDDSRSNRLPAADPIALIETPSFAAKTAILAMFFADPSVHFAISSDDEAISARTAFGATLFILAKAAIDCN